MRDLHLPSPNHSSSRSPASLGELRTLCQARMHRLPLRHDQPAHPFGTLPQPARPARASEPSGSHVQRSIDRHLNTHAASHRFQVRVDKWIDLAHDLNSTSAVLVKHAGIRARSPRRTRAEITMKLYAL